MAKDPWLADAGGKIREDEAATVQCFSDEFQPFVKMHDSDEYLRKLETKLARLSNGKTALTSQGLIKMLAIGRNDHMNHLMQANRNCDSHEYESLDAVTASPVQMSSIVRRMYSNRQALAEEEVQSLVNFDHLQTLYAQLNSLEA